MDNFNLKNPLIKKNRLLLTLVVTGEGGEGNEWAGFVQTMKCFIKK